jgi:hypothetical protein
MAPPELGAAFQPGRAADRLRPGLIAGSAPAKPLWTKTERRR